jgi:hypothetical protein
MPHRRRRPSPRAPSHCPPSIRSVINDPTTTDHLIQHWQALATDAPWIAYAIAGHTERLARRFTRKFREKSKPNGKS